MKPLIEQTSGKPTGIGFTLASAPEFLRGKTALEDFLAPWMTVLASRDPQTLEKLVGIFEPFGGELRTFDNPVTAELIKVVHNAFNATKISFWNEIGSSVRNLLKCGRYSPYRCPLIRRFHKSLVWHKGWLPVWRRLSSQRCRWDH